VKNPLSSDFDIFKGYHTTVQPWEHGYQLGEAARKMLVPANGPISSLESTLIGLGVHVARARFSTQSIEAAGVWESGAVPVILLNTNATRVEYSLSRRAILAHELCHLLHDGGEADIATRVTCAMGTGNYQEALEQRARGFAPAFLAPSSQVNEWSTTANLTEDPSDIVYGLAAYWGLSFEGAIWHAKNCCLIHADTADKLAARDLTTVLPADQFERKEPASRRWSVDSGLSENPNSLMEGLAARVVMEALEDTLISLGRAKELLALR